MILSRRVARSCDFIVAGGEKCGANDICVNDTVTDTLLQCPENNVSLPGSDDARDCVCEGGYRAEYF